MTTSLLIFLAEPIFSIFIREPDVLGAGVEYLRILGISQFFMLIDLT
ncbi:MATE family efflux transporter, partial [[Clostridium] symbiosum]